MQNAPLWNRLAGVGLGFMLFAASAHAAPPDADDPKPGSYPAPRTPPTRRLGEPLAPTCAIDWPTLLELAHASSLEIQMAAARLEEAEAGVGLAKGAWLPSIRVGASYLHHDGRIQDIPGDVINANKNALFVGPLARLTLDPGMVAADILRAKQLTKVRAGQLNRASRQQVHDASQAFVDLQAVQAGSAILNEAVELLSNLVDRAKQFKKVGKFSPLQVDVYQSELSARNLDVAKLRLQHRAAGLRLADILGLDQSTRLYALEEHVPILQLVNIDVPDEELVAAALRDGPGIEEVSAVLRGLEEQLELAGKYRFAPSFSADVGYGEFGGGVGTTYQNFGSRLDVGAHVYWDLSDLAKIGAKRKLYQSKRRQSEVSRDQVYRKLTTGVRVAVEQARDARRRLVDAEEYIRRMIEQYSNVRELKNVPAPSDVTSMRDDYPSQVFNMYTLEANTIGQLAKARNIYLEAVLENNKAQVTLQFLTGLCQQPLGSGQDAAAPAATAPSGSSAGPSSSPGSTSDANGSRQTALQPVHAKGTRIRGPVPRMPVDDRVQ